MRSKEDKNAGIEKMIDEAFGQMLKKLCKILNSFYLAAKFQSFLDFFLCYEYIYSIQAFSYFVELLSRFLGFRVFSSFQWF